MRSSASPLQPRITLCSWRFALVALIGFCLTYLLMSLFVERLGAPYLPAQLLTTILIMFVTFAINRLWTFAHSPAGR
jgi:putative flippase GtrA